MLAVRSAPEAPFQRQSSFCRPGLLGGLGARLAGVSDQRPRLRWRRRAALGVLGAWGLLSVARLSRLIEPPEEVPPGREVVPALEFFRSTIPRDAGYLFVEPGAFGADSGAGQRLRYELYPRTYDDVRASADEASVRQLMRDEGLGYVVVADASQYAEGSWLRAPRDWLWRIELDADRYVLQVVG